MNANPAGERSSVWPAVGAVAALVGGVGGLLGGLAAAGVFDDDAEPTPTPATAVSQSPVPTPVPAAAGAERVSASLVYLQGGTGCSPDITVTIGDRSFVPVGVRYAMNDLLSGQQTYSVAGTVSCMNGAGCVGDGSGSIDVVAGADYEVFWQEVALGACDLTVRR